MDWGGVRVLVTGAGGFIGSHLVEALAEAGAQVRAFVRYNSQGRRGALEQVDPRLLAGVEIAAGDLREEEAVSEAAKGSRIVFHLGAEVSIPYSYLYPGEVAATNIVGALNVLKACRRQEVERLVHTSSSEVYGSARYVPMDEGHPLQAQSPYAATKIGADMLVESFRRSYGLRTVILRPFNTYGPRQSTRAVIASIIAQALAGEEVRIGATHPKRDLLFVSDTVRAFLQAGESEEALGEVINLGTGEAIEIGEAARLILRLVGRELPIRADPARLRPEESEVTELAADIGKAKRLLRWSPTISLEEGLKRTIDWFREHISEYRPDRYAF